MNLPISALNQASIQNISIQNQTSSIESIRSATSAEWDGIWKSCDYATFFHSREWAEIWSIATQGSYSPEPKLFTFSDGKQIILPFSKKKKYKGLSSEYFLSPEGVFGGWLSADSLEFDHAKLLINWLVEKFQNNLMSCQGLSWVLNPYEEVAVQAIDAAWLMDYETYAMNLQQDFEQFFSGKKMTKLGINKARRSGISIKIASTLEEWRGYYKAYQNSLQRWGENRHSDGYSWELFEQMFQRRSPHIKLWIATLDNQVISGELCFYAKTNVIAWTGATLEDYFPLRPVVLLKYEIMKDAYQQGYKWFDFNPSPGLDNVTAFKKSLGASTLKCPILMLKTPLSRLVDKVEYRLQHFNL